VGAGLYADQVTVKEDADPLPDPLSARPDGVDSPSSGSSMIIGSAVQKLLSILPDPLRPAAAQPVKRSAPKSASGKMSVEVGASMIHSTEDRDAEGTVV